MARINLSGEVITDDWQEIYDWFGVQGFSPQLVREAITSNPEGEELVFEINSPGGSVFAGNEMYTVIRLAKDKGVRTVAEIQSMAGSAASYLCLGCDRVVISPVAQMMVHLPSTYTEGDRVEHMRSVQMLDSTREAILNAYELKAGGRTDRAKFRRMMSNETWITAQEAVDLGLADGMMFDMEDSDPLNLFNNVGFWVRSLNAGYGHPPRDVMRETYMQAKLVRESKEMPHGDDGVDPPSPDKAPANHDRRCQQAQALLALETSRFINKEEK